MAKEQKRRLKKSHIILAIVAIAVLICITILIWPYISLFSDPEKARELISRAGPWAPLLFIALQILQVFIAPIPGQVTGFVGGYLFGTVFGTLYTIIGALIGFTLIFWLARRLGRPFVEHFVDKKYLDKFDYIANTNGVFVLFLIFLLPAFPDDIICYIAGLTNIKIRTLVFISLAGRLPGYLVLSFTGSGVAESNIRLVSIVFTVVMIISVAAFWQRKRIERFVKRIAKESDKK